jgi:hypothetical protein
MTVLALVGAVVTGAGQATAARIPSGVFAVLCPASHQLKDDPIVFPAMPGASHNHVFAGSTITDAVTFSYDELRAAPTTCGPGIDASADFSAYWQPSATIAGLPVDPIKAAAYYSSGLLDATKLHVYPHGLKLLAGDAHATGKQKIALVNWGCADGYPTSNQTAPPDCNKPRPNGKPNSHVLKVDVIFPSCLAVDSTGAPLTESLDHRSHAEYPKSTGVCPVDHPYAVPVLRLSYDYPAPADPTTFALSSGPYYTLHGDFINAWTDANLQHLIDICIVPKLVCLST